LKKISKFWKKIKNLLKTPVFSVHMQVGGKIKNFKKLYIYIYNDLFAFNIFNSQIWLNQLMDDCHLSYITKLRSKKSNGPKVFSKLLVFRVVLILLNETVYRISSKIDSYLMYLLDKSENNATNP